MAVPENIRALLVVVVAALLWPLLVQALRTHEALQEVEASQVAVDAHKTTHHVILQTPLGPRVVLLQKVSREEVPESLMAKDAERLQEEEIPLKVFITGPWKPERIIQANAEHLPQDTQFLYYDDAAMEQSIDVISRELEKRGLVKDLKDAFFMLRPWAFRADLWRAAIIWMHGGLYLDSKVSLQQPIEKLVDFQHDRLALCFDAGATLPGFWNGLFAAKQGEPALLTVMQVIVENVRSRAYDGTLGVSGPTAMFKALASFRQTDSHSVPSIRCTFKSDRITGSCGGVTELQHQIAGGWTAIQQSSCLGDSSYDREQLAEMDKQEHQLEHGLRPWYGQLYEMKAVYCDQAFLGNDDSCNPKGNGAFGPTWPSEEAIMAARESREKQAPKAEFQRRVEEELQRLQEAMRERKEHRRDLVAQK